MFFKNRGENRRRPGDVQGILQSYGSPFYLYFHFIFLDLLQFLISRMRMI